MTRAFKKEIIAMRGTIHRSCWRRAGRLAVVASVALVTARSASAQIAVTGDLIVQRIAAPGETYKGAITIRNTTDTVQVAILSLADYRFDASGSNSFDLPGSHPRSNTSWIALSQQAVSLPPKATQAIGYTVAVPVGTPQPMGTYWSVVLVETERRGDVAIRPSTFVITPRIRYAVQVATHVAGEVGECHLTFGEPQVKANQLAIDIADIEIRACATKLRLEVYDAEGALVHTVSQRGPFLYPATSARQRFELPDLLTGGYSFLLVADVGAETLQGATFHVQVP